MRNLFACFGFALALLCAQQNANGGVVVTLSEIGSDVVASGSGTLNLTALTFNGSGPGGSVFIDPDSNIIVVGPGPVAGMASVYGGVFSGPSSFGPGGPTAVSSGSGDLFAYGDQEVLVPVGYVSGSPLSGTSTWVGTSFSDLGVTPGTYIWTWGTGATADSFTLQIGQPSAVPEPGTLGALALAGLGFVVFRHQIRRS